MNREAKRCMFRAGRRDPDAIYCPVCKHRVKHVAVKVAGDVDHYTVHCAVCFNRLGLTREGMDGVTGEGAVKGRYWRTL